MGHLSEVRKYGGGGPGGTQGAPPGGPDRLEREAVEWMDGLPPAPGGGAADVGFIGGGAEGGDGDTGRLRGCLVVVTSAGRGRSDLLRWARSRDVLAVGAAVGAGPDPDEALVAEADVVVFLEGDAIGAGSCTDNDDADDDDGELDVNAYTVRGFNFLVRMLRDMEDEGADLGAADVDAPGR